jgi:hypothetical protein
VLELLEQMNTVYAREGDNTMPRAKGRNSANGRNTKKKSNMQAEIIMECPCAQSLRLVGKHC